jgi:hypothetical protein
MLLMIFHQNKLAIWFPNDHSIISNSFHKAKLIYIIGMAKWDILDLSSIKLIEKEVNICHICAIYVLIVNQFTLKAFKG